jgi:Zn-dependent alcohol dehydrogenase
MSLRDKQNKKALFSNFFGQSSFARLTVVYRSSLVKVRSDTDLALFAPLGCGLQTGAGAILNTLDVQVGKTVAIFGVGSVGMSAVMAAKIRGAKEIIAIDLQQSRLDLAKSLGATSTILGNDADIILKIKRISPPNGVHYGLDCSGAPAVIETMINCLGSRGRATSVGAPAVSRSKTLIQIPSPRAIADNSPHSLERLSRLMFLHNLFMGANMLVAARGIPSLVR